MYATKSGIQESFKILLEIDISEKWDVYWIHVLNTRYEKTRCFCYIKTNHQTKLKSSLQNLSAFYWFQTFSIFWKRDKVCQSSAINSFKSMYSWIFSYSISICILKQDTIRTITALESRKWHLDSRKESFSLTLKSTNGTFLRCCLLCACLTEMPKPLSKYWNVCFEILLLIWAEGKDRLSTFKHF